MLTGLFMLIPNLYRGYMAPEYIYRGELSMHSDIYNLGHIIIETATGEKNERNNEDLCGRKLIDYVKQHQ